MSPLNYSIEEAQGGTTVQYDIIKQPLCNVASDKAAEPLSLSICVVGV